MGVADGAGRRRAQKKSQSVHKSIGKVASSDKKWSGLSPAAVTVVALAAVAAVWWSMALGGAQDVDGSTRQPRDVVEVDLSQSPTPSKPRDARAVSRKDSENELVKAGADSEQGRHALVVRRLERLLHRGAHPDVVLRIRYELADAYHALSNNKGVEEQLTRAAQFAEQRGSDEKAVARWNLAKLHLGRKVLPRESIISLLLGVVEADPQHDNALHWLGHQLMQSPTGYRDAAAYLSRVRLSKLTDSNPLDTVMLLGQAQERLGNLEGTAVAFGKAIKLYEATKRDGRQMQDKIRYRFALSHFQYCKALLLLGEAERALHAATAASYEFPEVYHIMDAVGLSLAAAGRWKETVAHYNAVQGHLKTWPDFARGMPERVLGATFAKLHEDRRRRSSNRDAQIRNFDIDEDNGGWPQTVLHNLTTTKCNIDIRPGLTPKQFMTEYANRNLPVIVPDALKDWPAVKTWQRASFEAKYGKKPVRVRRSVDIAYDNEFGGLRAAEVDLVQYLNDTFGPTDSPITNVTQSRSGDTRYVLQSLDWGTGFREDYIPPIFFSSSDFAWNSSQRDAAALAFFGPAGSSVTLHEHTNAWNALMYGMKRWVMLPPYVQYGPTGLPVEQWLSEWYPRFKDEAFECTQLPGDLLYVPTNYMHTLVNLRASIGVAVEFGHNLQLLRRGVQGAQAELNAQSQ